MEKSYILLDVGGTQIKGGISDASGNLKGEIKSFDAHSMEDKEAIFDNFAMVIGTLIKQAGDTQIAGAGMAFPGPFDYENGISLMKGLNKYDSIYGIPIEAELKNRLPGQKETKFSFLHDVEAFAIGESRFGDARNAHKVFCLCIGTGAGSAFVKDGIPQKEEKDGIPPNGWIYGIPYKDGTIDDYLSVRGLHKISETILGKPLNGKELYELCSRGDLEALSVYQTFGDDLLGCALPFLDSFAPDAVVLGGQISKSFSYFGQKFLEECSKRGIKVYLESETSVKAMQGVFAKMSEEG